MTHSGLEEFDTNAASWTSDDTVLAGPRMFKSVFLEDNLLTGLLAAMDFDELTLFSQMGGDKMTLAGMGASE